MLLLIDGTPGSDIAAFLIRLQEETMPCTIMTYDAWLLQIDCDSKSICSKLRCNDHENPEGIILMRVMPEIAHKRLQQNMGLDQIRQIYAEKEDIFIHNKNNPEELRNLPVLVLNGNIDFQIDFSHFYNHLFYIRRFIKEIQEKKDLMRGIHKEKVHRKCC